MACEGGFPDTLIDENPQRALEEINGALRESSNNAEWLCQRAYAHILLKNYSCAAEDAKKAQQLQPGLAMAFLRAGMAEYHLNNFQAAHQALLEGQKLGSHSDLFQMWILRCEDSMPSQTQNGANSMQPAVPPPIKRDWYQTESQVIVTLMLKNAKNEEVQISFQERELSACVKLPSGEDYCLKLCLLHPVVPQQCTYRILSTKIEIKMKKTEAIRWEKLEGEGMMPSVKHFTPNQYPSSCHYTRNWDKLVGDIKEEEKNEKLEGDAALNKLFQQIYTDGSDEVKRAMNKSFSESGGTVLSTNWTDVGTRKVEMSPPDDVEFKKY